MEKEKTREKIPTAGKEDGTKKLILYAVGVLAVIGVLGVGAVLLLGLVGMSLPSLGGGECVGVVTLDGELTTAETPRTLFSQGVEGSEGIAKTIEEVGKRDDVKAMLIVVNSPGGSVVASREIYQAVKDVKKPKVAYFREVAASGGYMAAAPTDYIVSDPDVLTGSIGTRVTVMEMSGLFEKIGVNMSTVTTGKMKDMGDMNRPMTDEERQVFQALVDDVFTEFRTAVEEGRGSRLDRQEFEKILDGRVLSARQAKQAGLIDEIGDKKRALEKAADMGGIKVEKGKDVPVCEIGGDGGALGDLFSSLSFEMGKQFGKGIISSGAGRSMELS